MRTATIVERSNIDTARMALEDCDTSQIDVQSEREAWQSCSSFRKLLTFADVSTKSSPQVLRRQVSSSETP